MWYNVEAKIVEPERCYQHPPAWIHLIGDVPMPTVPSRARKSKRFTIYALIDPRDMAIRYIGITEDVYQRMRQHSRCEGNNAEKTAWIEELQKEQLMFIMQSLEKVKTIEEALTREQHWIRHHLEQGAKLTNIAGVPSKLSTEKKPAEKQPDKFSYANLDKFYFKTEDNRVVSLMKSTNRDFHAFIQQHVKLSDDWDVEDWSDDWRRRKVMAFAHKNEIEIELLSKPEGGESRYLWIVERDPNPPEVIA